ncbi:MAG TPA: RDD family protein [Blastocatellia bacterium]|nr:RDD family protein [Blastocatellia bacterium]
MLDDELVIETPERVELHYVLANVGNRFLAAAIDHLIQAAAVFIIVVIVGAFNDWRIFSGLSGWTVALLVLVGFAIYWGYFVLFETLWSGQTPGKRIMKLRVVREDGRPVRFFEAFVRNLLRLALDFWPFPSYAVGVISIIFSARSKRVGDFVAGTVVVKERATEAPSLDDVIRFSEAEQRRVERAAPAPFLADTRLLDERELQAIETFLKRRYELTQTNRAMLARRIAAPVAAKLGIANEQLISPETLLEEIERQHRAQSRYFD